MTKAELLERLPQIQLPEEQLQGSEIVKIEKITWHEQGDIRSKEGFTPHSRYQIYDHTTEIQEEKAYLLNEKGKKIREIEGTSHRTFHESSSHMEPDGRSRGESVGETLKRVSGASYLLVEYRDGHKSYYSPGGSSKDSYTIEIYPLS